MSEFIRLCDGISGDTSIIEVFVQENPRSLIAMASRDNDIALLLLSCELTGDTSSSGISCEGQGLYNLIHTQVIPLVNKLYAELPIKLKGDGSTVDDIKTDIIHLLRSLAEHRFGFKELSDHIDLHFGITFIAKIALSIRTNGVLLNKLAKVLLSVGLTFSKCLINYYISHSLLEKYRKILTDNLEILSRIEPHELTRVITDPTDVGEDLKDIVEMASKWKNLLMSNISRFITILLRPFGLGSSHFSDTEIIERGFLTDLVCYRRVLSHIYSRITDAEKAKFVEIFRNALTVISDSIVLKRASSSVNKDYLLNRNYLQTLSDPTQLYDTLALLEERYYIEYSIYPYHLYMGISVPDGVIPYIPIIDAYKSINNEIYKYETELRKTGKWNEFSLSGGGSPVITHKGITFSGESILIQGLRGNSFAREWFFLEMIPAQPVGSTNQPCSNVVKLLWMDIDSMVHSLQVQYFNPDRPSTELLANIYDIDLIQTIFHEIRTFISLYSITNISLDTLENDLISISEHIYLLYTTHSWTIKAASVISRHPLLTEFLENVESVLTIKRFLLKRFVFPYIIRFGIYLPGSLPTLPYCLDKIPRGPIYNKIYSLHRVQIYLLCDVIRFLVKKMSDLNHTDSLLQITDTSGVSINSLDRIKRHLYEKLVYFYNHITSNPGIPLDFSLYDPNIHIIGNTSVTRWGLVTITDGHISHPTTLSLEGLLPDTESILPDTDNTNRVLEILMKCYKLPIIHAKPVFTQSNMKTFLGTDVTGFRAAIAYSLYLLVDEHISTLVN